MWVLFDKPLQVVVFCLLDCQAPVPPQTKMTLQAFLALQLSRLKEKPPNHARGPKRPTLSQTESEKNK